MAQNAQWQSWLAAAQGGDRRAYSALLAAALPWLRIQARKRWPRLQPAAHDDIVQETLLALHRNLHIYDPSRPVEPFLYGILKLRGADLLRQRMRRQRREDSLDDVPVTSSVLTTKAEQEDFVDQRTATEALKTLSQRDREILEMLKLRETSLRDASALTGMSVAALKVATFRAMRRLKAAMGGDDGN
jgi:RNA polymerase sigma-70 factor (ECF subfamily)